MPHGPQYSSYKTRGTSITASLTIHIFATSQSTNLEIQTHFSSWTRTSPLYSTSSPPPILTHAVNMPYCEMHGRWHERPPKSSLEAEWYSSNTGRHIKTVTLHGPGAPREIFLLDRRLRRFCQDWGWALTTTRRTRYTSCGITVRQSRTHHLDAHVDDPLDDSYVSPPGTPTGEEGSSSRSALMAYLAV